MNGLLARLRGVWGLGFEPQEVMELRVALRQESTISGPNPKPHCGRGLWDSFGALFRVPPHPRPLPPA